jgi:hypothetical protein
LELLVAQYKKTIGYLEYLDVKRGQNIRVGILNELPYRAIVVVDGQKPFFPKKIGSDACISGTVRKFDKTVGEVQGWDISQTVIHNLIVQKIPQGVERSKEQTIFQTLIDEVAVYGNGMVTIVLHAAECQADLIKIEHFFKTNLRIGILNGKENI